MQSRFLTMDHWIFAGKTCLVASVLLAIVLLFKASYRPGNGLATSAGSVTITTKTDEEAASPRLELQPPRLAAGSVMQIEVQSSGRQKPVSAIGFCVQLGAGRNFLVTHASLMSRAEWEQVTQVTMLPARLQLKQRPWYIGALTEDSPPNLLARPDLGQDAVYWQVEETHQVDSLRIGIVEKGDPAWIAGLNQMFRCEVLEYSDTLLSVKPLARITLEELIGSPVVNAQGEVVGTVLGGNDLVVTGGSGVGLRRVLEQKRQDIPRRGGL